MSTVDTTRPLYLDGRWVDSDETIEVTNPADGQTIARIATTSRAQVRQAIADAKAALPAWSRMTAIARGDVLLGIAAALDQRLDEIARIITIENGKPLAQSQGEVKGTIDHFRWFAEEGRRVYGRIIPHQVDGKRHLVLRHPIGVVGAIAPWNFPLMLSARKVASAMAAGCPVVLKPASATPLCALALAECAEQAGLPAGVFQVVLGNSSEIGAEMLANPDCRKISFTGSTDVGKKLLEGSSQTVTKLSLELGGHAPFLVFEDADIDQAVAGAMIAKFRNTGQSCIAANRIYVQRPIYDRFLDAFVTAVKAMKVGNGLEEGIEIGAMIDHEALENALGHIEEAKALGGRVLCGGRQSGTTGAFIEPTVLADVPEHAQCMREETFAPVAPVCPFDTEQQAIAQANNTRYGLAAYAYTRDLNRALRLAESLEAGSICINDSVPSTSQCPFGGFKESGWGRELGVEGLDAYLETKHVSIGGVADP